MTKRRLDGRRLSLSGQNLKDFCPLVFLAKRPRLFLAGVTVNALHFAHGVTFFLAALGLGFLVAMVILSSAGAACRSTAF